MTASFVFSVPTLPPLASPIQSLHAQSTYSFVTFAGRAPVADYSAIRKISPAGVVTTIAGSNSLTGASDGVGPSARFYGLRSCAVDPAGNLLLADATVSSARYTQRRLQHHGRSGTVDRARRMLPGGAMTAVYGLP